MTEAQPNELLSRENAALRRRVEQLELALAQLGAAASPSAARPAAADFSAVPQHYAELFEQAPVIAFEMDTELHTRLWNHTCERLFGYSASEMRGKNPYLVLGRTADPAESARSAAEMRAKGWTRSVLPATTKTGRQIVCAWISTYLTDAAGQRVGIACYGRDLTEERASERARREAEVLFATTFETAAWCAHGRGSTGGDDRARSAAGTARLHRPRAA